MKIWLSLQTQRLWKITQGFMKLWLIKKKMFRFSKTVIFINKNKILRIQKLKIIKMLWIWNRTQISKIAIIMLLMISRQAITFYEKDPHLSKVKLQRERNSRVETKFVLLLKQIQWYSVSRMVLLLERC